MQIFMIIKQYKKVDREKLFFMEYLNRSMN